MNTYKYLFFVLYLFAGISAFSQNNCSVNIVSNSQYVCNGSNATINANTSGMGQNPNFSWTVNGISNPSNNNSIIIPINGNNPTTVICSASNNNNNNNCTDSDTILIYGISPGTINSNQYVCNGSIPNTIISSNSGSTSQNLSFGSSYAAMSTCLRAYGLPVRCLKN